MASLQSVTKWESEHEVIVCGAGAAGCSASIALYDLDTKISQCILEKAPESESGGNARVAGQSLLIVSSPDAMAQYQKNMSKSNPVPDDLLVWWANEMAQLETWIMQIAKDADQEYIRNPGFTSREVVREFPELGADQAVRYSSTILPFPSGVYHALKKNVSKRNIPITYNARVVDLIQDPDSLEVYGVVVQGMAGKQYHKATRGVILAMGGYEANLQMQRDYYGLDGVYPLGTPHNTGDGIVLLQKAGAQLWHMRNRGQSGGLWPGIKLAHKPTAYLRNFFLPTFSWFDVDALGNRFYPETEDYSRTHYKQKKHGAYIDTPLADATPIWMLLDASVLQAGKLVIEIMGWSGVVDTDYLWSDDNQKEIANGTIIAAQSIQELASNIRVPFHNLQNTFTQYQESCRNKNDPTFARNPETLFALQGPPYYAVSIVPSIVCTGGGGKRDTKCQVLDHNNKPVPRLYEAGELGSMISDLYQNGSYLTEAMITGKQSAASVAVQKPHPY
ncbi:MAG: FAD-binding protein [Methylacidiphilales bacterium]|nr:FAD-binding protein [Candidatus Methylacidiphilales bacterium]